MSVEKILDLLDLFRAFRPLLQEQENTAAEAEPLKFGFIKSVRLEGWRSRPKEQARNLAIMRPWQQCSAFLLSFSCPLWTDERGMTFRYGWKSNVSLLVLNCFPMTIASSAV